MPAWGGYPGSDERPGAGCHDRRGRERPRRHHERQRGGHLRVLIPQDGKDEQAAVCFDDSADSASSSAVSDETARRTPTFATLNPQIRSRVAKAPLAAAKTAYSLWYVQPIFASSAAEQQPLVLHAPS